MGIEIAREEGQTLQPTIPPIKDYSVQVEETLLQTQDQKEGDKNRKGSQAAFTLRYASPSCRLEARSSGWDRFQSEANPTGRVCSHQEDI